MKITKQLLREIIQEEINKTLLKEGSEAIASAISELKKGSTVEMLGDSKGYVPAYLIENRIEQIANLLNLLNQSLSQTRR